MYFINEIADLFIFPSFIKTEIDALELLHLLDVSHNDGKLVGKQELQRSINEMLGN